MKNAKLNVISMSCGDVIATSCASSYGLVLVVDKRLHYALINGAGVADENLTKIVKANVKGMDDGYYHCDKNGNITEKCPCTEYEDAVEAHDIK